MARSLQERLFNGGQVVDCPQQLELPFPDPIVVPIKQSDIEVTVEEYDITLAYKVY